MAWEKFKCEALAFIPPPKCFKESDPSAKKKRDNYREIYKHQAVLHFLPHFSNLLPLVTGEHEKRVLEAIRVLERWKRDLPDGAKKQFDNLDVSKIQFNKADSPPAIMLPMPPTKK